MTRRPSTLPKIGYDGGFELAPGLVDDPNPIFRGQKQAVAVNGRESSLAVMLAKGQIDEAQCRSGDWLRRQYERMRIGSGAIDPSHEPVDTSGHTDPIPDRLLMASLKIHDARAAVVKEVGNKGWALLEAICVEGCLIAEAAGRRYGRVTQSQARYVGMLFRDALDALAEHLGFATQNKTRI
jgi:hypothetical protein